MKFFTGILLSVLFMAFMQVPAELQPGDKAPLFMSMSRTMDTVRIDKYAPGDLVYLHFWASWNAPSRKQNLENVKVYDKYNGKAHKGRSRVHFISMSLDTREELWVAASKQDNLKWKSNVCELAGWNAKIAEIYKVRSLPTSFLIGKDLVIRAKNIYGKELEQQIDSLLLVPN